MTETPPCWCVVGNIGGVRGESDGLGTKHFSHGTKVYLCSRSYGDTGGVPVVGRHRCGGRMVGVWMQTKHIVNLRVKLVRDPSALSKIKTALLGGYSCEQYAQEYKAQLEAARITT